MIYVKRHTGGYLMINREIVSWVKRQTYWEQYLANEILEGKSLSEDDLEEIYLLFKKEFGLSEESLEKVKLDFLSLVDHSNEEDKIKWRSVSNVIGVNALKPNEKLEIGEQLTLIYGENGSGKSGYTRLFNNAFVSRGDKNILPNVFNRTNTQVSATFNFVNEDGELLDFIYPNIGDQEILKKIAVFDSVSATNDLTCETEVSFAPIEFKFFDKYAKSFSAIKQRLNDELAAINTKNEFLDYFTNETIIRQSVEKIDSKTDINYLKVLAKITDVDEETYKQKMRRKVKLQALNIKEKEQEYTRYENELNKIRERIEVLNNKFSDTRIMKTKELIIERNQLKLLSAEEGIAQLKGENIYRLGSVEWKDFILTAQSYYNSIQEEIEHCIFCGQDITHIKVIDKYWKYLKSVAEQNLITAESNIKKIIQDFSKQDFHLLVQESKFDDWLKKNDLVLRELLIEAETKYEEVNSLLIDNLNSLDWKTEVKEYHFNIDSFEKAYTLLKKEVSKLDADSIDKKIKDLKIYEDLYRDKLQLNNLLPKIEVFIKNLQWVDKARSISITTGKLTNFQKKLFTKYVTQEYMEKFDEECRKLKANFSAEIKQRGRRGATLSTLSVKGRKPVEILSEGEQRSISLANFLAETNLNRDNVCIVLDDPVCSLDYKRRDIIADRLVEEADNKQVVILTHDITFLMSVQKLCEEKNIKCDVVTIRKINQDAGIIQYAIPWIGAPVKERIGYLQNRLQSVEKVYKEYNLGNIELYDRYGEEAKLWCEQLRETWERTIEEILFNNSVQRFNPAIQTQRLKRAAFTQELYQEVEKGMSKCSNWVHDRASGLGEEIPTPEQLTEYLAECRSFVKKNKPK